MSRRRGKAGEEASADFPLSILERTYHEFRFEPEGEVSSLSVAGTFNGWSQGVDPMTDTDDDGVFTARVAVDPGRHMYKFVFNGDWIADPENPEQSLRHVADRILTTE